MKQLTIQWKTLLGSAALGIGAALLILFAVVNHRNPLPEPYPHGIAATVVSNQGEILRSFADSSGVFRYDIELDEVSDFYIQSLLNYEDRWFYYHFGVNPFSLLRAAWQWVSSGHVVSGGSTITMQVARLIDPHSRSISGKIQQIFRAIQLELQYSKDEILTLYINLAPFGGNISGVESAAQKYFGKKAADLNMNEATTLVVIPQKPSVYRPDRHPELALEMRNKVLARSLQAELISEKDYRMLVNEPLGVSIATREIHAPLLSRQLKTKQPNAPVINTTIDFALQHQLKTMLKRTASQLPARSSVAALVIRNNDGAVLGYQGMADFNDTSRFAYIDMIQALRSPGSTLKPFIYGLAMDQRVIHSESLLSDIPVSYSGYKPTNLSQIFHGGVSVSQALKMSLNVPVVQVLNKITPQLLLEKVQQTDVVFQHHDAGLTVALGGVGTNLWSLVKLYRSLAYHGEVIEPYTVQQERSHQSVSLLSKESSWIIFKILSSATAPDRIVPATRREIAWKTGTSYGYRDFWSVGVSKDYTVGVWVGRPDASPMVGYLGATQAAPIMFDVFDQLPEDKSRVEKPETVKQVEICWPGGQQKQFTKQDKCLSSHMAYTVNGIAPPTMDSFGQFVVDSAHPTQLAIWQAEQDKRKPVDELPLKISNLRAGQHFFRQEIKSLPLISNKPEQQVLWYINGKFQAEAVIPFGQYKGKTKIAACLKMSCDSVEITIH